MPRRKKIVDTIKDTDDTLNNVPEKKIKKKRGRKKKKTLDSTDNIDNIVVIDFKRDDIINTNTNQINNKKNMNENEIELNNSDNSYITNNNITNELDNTNMFSNDLILHLKTNNKNIVAANIDNNTNFNSFAPFNNSNDINNNINNNINNLINYKNSSIPESKNIFSFISEKNDTDNTFSVLPDENNFNTNLNNNFKYSSKTNMGNKIKNNSNMNSNNFDKDIQKIMRNNIRKIKYSFDNNRKWLSNSDVHCLWDCHKFDTVPIAIPKKVCGDTFHLFGYFCSFNCAASYIFENSVLSSNKWEYYSLLCLLQKKITGDNNYKKINFAPPKECLKIFGGFLSIEEFREQFNLVDYNMMLPPMIPIESTIENSVVQG